MFLSTTTTTMVPNVVYIMQLFGYLLTYIVLKRLLCTPHNSGGTTMRTLTRDSIAPLVAEEGIPGVGMLTDDAYFISYEDVEIHRLMVGDEPRTRAYAEAISKNKHLFHNKVVMDVGAGTGILSLFMAAAGARKVFAVEASGTATLIEHVARDNGFAEVIQVLHDRVENVTLPGDEKVDVIVSEWMGFYLLHESMLNSVIFARDHFLADDGTVFPSEARIYACPCSLQTLYKEQINFWDNVYGFNMCAVKNYALKSKMTKPEVYLVKESDLRSNPTCIKKFNLRWVTEKEVQLFTTTTFVGVTRSGAYQGLCLWFECDFEGRDYDEEGQELGALVTLSTSPFSPATHWKQTVVVFGYGAENSSHSELNESGSAQEMSNNAVSIMGASKSDEDKEKEKGLSNKNHLKNDIEKLPGTKNLPNNESHDTEDIKEGMQPQEMKNLTQSLDSTNDNINFANLVEEDEVVGWKLVMRQTENNVRHYTMMVEMLDPETEEHPTPCLCPTPRCRIIAKIMEKEIEEEELIDCT